MTIDALYHLPLWLGLPLLFTGWVLVFSVIKNIAFHLAVKIAARTAMRADDVLVAALDLPLRLMIYATGAVFVLYFIPAGEPDIAQYIWGGFKIISILALVFFADRFLRGLVDVYAQKVDVLRTSSGIVRGFIRVVVFVLGALVALDSFGISITPIIASLGIGSLGVALALQPTLENFFAGIQLLTDKPVQVGQFIKLESGEEGTVSQIGWRSTWVCQPNNTMVVIPNKLLVNSRVTNFFYPDAQLAVSVTVPVHYAADLQKVEQVTLAVARDVNTTVPGGVSSAEPVLRYNAFGDSAIQLNVVLRAMDFSSGALLKHEFIKRLHRRYEQDGIALPYLTQAFINDKKVP